MNHKPIFLVLVILLTIAPAHAEQAPTIPEAIDLVVEPIGISVSNQRPFDGERFAISSVQVKNSGSSPVLCYLLKGLDNGDKKISNDEYWASFAHSILPKTSTSFDELMELMHDASLYPTDTALFSGITLLKEKRFIIETGPLTYRKAVAAKDYSFCKIKVLDSIPGQGSTVLKEFTLKSNLNPGNAVLLSTEMEEYEIHGTGMHGIQVLVDPENALPEDNKNNNVAEMEINVEPFLPDMHFISPNWIYNRGKAPLLCRRIITSHGSVSQYKPAFGVDAREQVATYSLLLGVVDIVVENNTKWFDNTVVQLAYDRSKIFDDFYQDYDDTEAERMRVYEKISDNLLNRDNLNEYLKLMGGYYALIDGFETGRFCTFGDSSSAESVCSTQQPIQIDRLMPGEFISLLGRPGAFSHPNCIGMEDANTENDLFSGEVFTPDNENAQFFAKLRVTAAPENPECTGVLNIYTSHDGKIWNLAHAIVISEKIDQIFDISGLFTYIKVEGNPCKLKESSVLVESTNYGDPLARVSEACGNGIGWSEVAEGEVTALGKPDECYPNIQAHIHNLGDAIEVLVPEKKDDITYLTEELHSESDIEIIVQDRFTVPAGNTTRITFYVKNSGMMEIDKVRVSAETCVGSKLVLDPAELSGILPGSIQPVEVVLTIPWHERGGDYYLTLSAERAGYRLKTAETILNIEMNDRLILYPIYALITMAFIGLVFTVLKYTGVHDKLFKNKK